MTELSAESMEKAMRNPTADARHGPLVTLWRRLRTGEETTELLPDSIAEMTLHLIPLLEPQVERAKIVRE